MTSPHLPPAQPIGVSAGAPPPIVRQAVRVLWGVAAVGVVRMIYVLLAHDRLVNAYAKTQPSGLPRDLVAQQAPAYTVTTLVNALALGVIIAAASLYVLRGKSWARTTALLACWLSMPSGLYTLVQPATAPYRILGVLTVILGLAAIVMLYQKPAGRYFNR